MKNLLIKFIEKNFPAWEKRLRVGFRSGVDRRAEDPRRTMVKKEYYESGVTNRRVYEDRRQKTERRTNWIRVGYWKSRFAG